MNHPPPFSVVAPGVSSSPLPQRTAAHDAEGVLQEAFSCIVLCNEYMQPRATVVALGGRPKVKIHTPELPPFQEAMMRHACTYVGKYFAAASKRFEADDG